MTVYMQLVGVLYGDSELSTAELQQCIRTREKNKSTVTITTSDGQIVVQRPSDGSKVRFYWLCCYRVVVNS
jgi:hypothetical protein